MIAPLVCLALAWIEPTAAELMIRRYPLDHLRADSVSCAVAPLPLRSADFGHGEWSSDEDESYDVDPDTIVELVRRLVEPDEWEYAGRSIEITDDVPTMEIVAPKRVHEQVGRLIEFVAAATMTPVTLRADVLRVTGDADLAPIAADPSGANPLRAIEAMVGSGDLQPQASFRVSLLSGISAMRTRLTSTSYLRDYDAEIAEASAVLQPVIDHYAIGVAAALRADRERDGGVLVQFAVTDAWQEAMLTESCSLRFRMATESNVEMVSSGGPIQFPSLGFASMAGSCRLVEGETRVAVATAATPGSEGRGVVLALTLLKCPQPPDTLTLGERTLYLTNVAGDVTTGFRTEELGELKLAWPAADVTGDEPFLAALPVGTTRDGEDMDQFVRAFERAYEAHENDEDADDEDSEFDYGTRGTMLYALGTNKCVKRAIAGVRSVPLEHADRTVGIRTAAGLLASVPVAVGEGIAICGTQESYIHHYDVDVANRVSMSHPQVSAGTSGYVFHVRATATSQGAWASLATHLRDGGRGAFDSDSDEVGVHHFPRFLVAEASARVASEGQAALGEFALPGGKTATVSLSARK